MEVSMLHRATASMDKVSNSQTSSLTRVQGGKITMAMVTITTLSRTSTEETLQTGLTWSIRQQRIRR
jgi:hypothetical protein